jgi:hypothetical protein
MKPTIQFESEPETHEGTSLCQSTKGKSKPTYEDLILKPEYRDRRFSFPEGKTVIRVLPQLAGAPGWMQAVFTLNYTGGRHAHPKSVTPRAESVFDHAYRWLRSTTPTKLWSKLCPDGYRLLTSPMAICWLLLEIDGQIQSRLFLGGAYNGSAGGSPGIAHKLFELASQLNADGHDAAHSEHGVQITVEKTSTKGEKYPVYSMTRHEHPAPIKAYLEKMAEEEVNVICPLTDMIYQVNAEQEWELLAKIVGDELRNEIRSAVSEFA